MEHLAVYCSMRPIQRDGNVCPLNLCDGRYRETSLNQLKALSMYVFIFKNITFCKPLHNLWNEVSLSCMVPNHPYFIVWDHWWMWCKVSLCGFRAVVPNPFIYASWNPSICMCYQLSLCIERLKYSYSIVMEIILRIIWNIISFIVKILMIGTIIYKILK